MTVSIHAQGRLRRAARGLPALVLCLAFAGVAKAQPSTEELRGLFTPGTADQQPAATTDQQPAAPAPDPRCQDHDFREANDFCSTRRIKATEQGFKLFDTATVATAPSHGGGRPPGPRTHIGVVRTHTPGADCAFTDAVGGGNLCVTFGLASADLTGKSRAGLDRLAGVMLKDYPDSRLSIEGFTDSSGDPDKNLHLSDARAHAVVDYLVAKGVPASRLQAAGRGATNFLPGLPHTDAANRRVEARAL